MRSENASYRGNVLNESREGKANHIEHVGRFTSKSKSKSGSGSLSLSLSGFFTMKNMKKHEAGEEEEEWFNH